MKNCTVTFIITTYNREKYLLQCINSIIMQKWENIEIVIIDDNSSNDVYYNLFKTFDNNKIKYIKNDINMGPSYSRKLGLEKASGEFIIFCDDDDFYTDDSFIEFAYQIFSQKESVGIVGFDSYLFNEDTNERRHLREIKEDSIYSNIVALEHFQRKVPKPKSTFTTIFRKSKLIESGILDSSMVNDTIIYLYGLTKSDIFLSSKCIGCYRVHSHNMTKGVNSELILDTFEEKMKLSKVVERIGIDRRKWLLNQITLTAEYYWSNTDKRQQNKDIDNWILNKLRFNSFFLFLRKNCINYKRYIKERFL